TKIDDTPAVDANLVCQDSFANDVTGHSSKRLVDFVCTLFKRFAFARKRFKHFLVISIRSVLTFLLITDRVDFGESFTSKLFHCVKRVLFEWHEQWNFDWFIGRTISQVGLCFTQDPDKWLGGFETGSDNFFGRGGDVLVVDEFPCVVGGFGLDHHDGDVVVSDSAGNNHVEHSVFQLGVLRESDPLSVTLFISDQGDPYCTDWPGKIHAGQGGRHRGGVDCHAVVHFIWPDRGDGHYDLNLVADPVGK